MDSFHYNRFTDSLQKEYDAIKSVKSSARGVSKQMSDLIENITEARSLSMQLVDKHVNVKKQIAELNIKQKEKFGKNAILRGIDYDERATQRERNEQIGGHRGGES